MAVPRSTLPMALLLLCLSTTGCASTTQLSSSAFQDMSNQLAEEDMRIVMEDGTELDVKGVELSDSVSWVAPHTNQRSKASKQEVAKIIITRKDHLLGAVKGAGIGLLAGGLIGLAAVPKHEREFAGVYVVYFGGIGAFIGMFAGGAIGHNDHYEFQIDGEAINVEERP